VAGVSTGVAVAAIAKPTPARNTLRRVRIVGGLIMSISRLKALGASAEAVALPKDVKHNVVRNCVLVPLRRLSSLVLSARPRGWNPSWFA
jgi:hypothetical protein